VDRKAIWQNIYQSKPTDQLGWFQPHLRASLSLIEQVGLPFTAAIIDIGAGESSLTGDLLDQGFTQLSALDVAPAALERMKAGLGSSADRITWIEADITGWQPPSQAYDLWHDRALFHFLTAREDRLAYISATQQAIKNGGYLIVGTFASDGPTRCSGMETLRFSPQALSEEFGNHFILVNHLDEIHHTPSGAVQKFSYCLLKKQS
jgi:SAM-dependent methyltransferase